MAAPGGEDMAVSVCFPVYNEMAVLEEVLREAWQVLGALHPDSEIVCVDDCSADGSYELMEGLREEMPRLRVIRNRVNQGNIATVRTAFRAARCPWIFVNGSDGQWRTAELLRMLPLADRADLVVGRRRHKQYTPWRRLVSWAFNRVPVVLYGVATHDAGSVKLMRRELATMELASRSAFVEVERIVTAARRGYAVEVVDVDHFPRLDGPGGGASARAILHALRDMVEFTWRLWTRGLDR